MDELLLSKSDAHSEDQGRLVCLEKSRQELVGTELPTVAAARIPCLVQLYVIK
jgi:hypothetical protein